MDSKNALYFSGGMVLGVLGTLAFLWFWDERDDADDIPSEDAAEAENVEGQKALDRSSIDDVEFEEPAPVDYSTIVNTLYIPTTLETDRYDGQRRIDEQGCIDLAESGYETKELTLYSDGIIADSISDEVMSESDAFASLGPNYMPRKLQRIFSTERMTGTDAVYIENGRLFTLYEVTYDDRTFREVTGEVSDAT